MLKTGLSYNLDVTFNTSPANIGAQNNEDPTLTNVNPIFNGFLRPRSWGTLPPWGDLGLGESHVTRCKELRCEWRNTQVSCPGGVTWQSAYSPTPFSVTVLRSQHCGRVQKVKQQHFTYERVCRWKVFQFTSKTLWRFV